LSCFLSSRLLPGVVALTALLGVAGPASAEKADRTKPVNIEADQPGTVDLLKQVVVFNGNVVITQGTMIIRAQRVEVRETPEGFRAAVALGSTARPATYREKRQGVDEYIEGQAERIEYDGQADTVRFANNASVRRLRGSSVADEVTGNLITYDNFAETFSVQGRPAATPDNPSGRVRAVLSPAPQAPGPSASQVAPQLKPSTMLGEPR